MVRASASHAGGPRFESECPHHLVSVASVRLFLRPDETVGFLVELFEANTKSSSGISGVLNEYYETVKGIDTTTQDIFGEGNPSKLSMLQKAFLEYSSQTPEDLKMRSVDYTPSPEEIAEARRQKEEVKAKWTNPDGSMKKGSIPKVVE